MRSPHVIRALTALVLALSIATISCSGGSGPTGPGARTVQVYRNGFLFPWNGNVIGMETGNGVGTVAQTALADNVSGDASVMMVTISDGGGCLGTISGCVVNFTTAGAAPDMAAYYASGHVQFNIRLGASVTLSSVTVRGNAGGQYGSAALDLPSLSTTAFTHVSTPITSLFPPTTISTSVSVPFAMNILGTVVGSNIPTLYLNDVKWTKN